MSSGGPILEFGAGDGNFVERFLRDATEVECVEPDPSNQAMLRTLVPRIATDIMELPARRYPFAYTINVLEHIRDLDEYLLQLHRVLRPSGRLFVFVPAFNFLWTSLDDEVGHIQRFTRLSLITHLERAGFRIEQSYYFDSLGFFAAIGVRILEKIGMFKFSPRTIGIYDRLVPISLMGDRLLSGVLGKNVIVIAHKA